MTLLIKKKKKTFKSTNIICVIHETIQMGLQNDLSFSIHYYTINFLNKVPSDQTGRGMTLVSVQHYSIVCQHSVTTALQQYFNAFQFVP